MLFRSLSKVGTVVKFTKASELSTHIVPDLSRHERSCLSFKTQLLNACQSYPNLESKFSNQFKSHVSPVSIHTILISFVKDKIDPTPE